jgi:hypothetical protein
VRGNGDGGIYTTVADVSAFWHALYEGRIISLERVSEMTRPHSTTDSARYGLGFWLDAESAAVSLEGCDTGVSFRSTHDPGSRVTFTVVSNTTDGAWPILRLLRARLA